MLFRSEPERALVLTSKSLPAGIYAFVLAAAGDGTTRLICRDRSVSPWWERPFMLLLYEPLHAYMQTGLLQGIKERVERCARTMPQVEVQSHLGQTEAL